MLVRCYVAGLLVLAGWFWHAAAQALEPELRTPYKVQVVLHIANNRFLTAIFQERVERELRDDLQLTFGRLAKVEVVRDHPLLGEVLRQGLRQALDGWEEVSDRSTYFVLLDYREGRYELRVRYHDGMTGQNSPVVRRDRTGDRRLVAKKAAGLIEHDFALVGTVMKVEAEEVQLGIQGGGLGVPLGRWIKPGDIFAIARLSRQGDKVRATRLPWALLQVSDPPRDGICRCRFFHRFQGENLAEGKDSVGHRCLKLATSRSPVRIRLIDDKTLHPLDGWEIHVSRQFGGQANQLTTDRDGLAVSREEFEHVAFVEVKKGNVSRARFPVELVDERTIVCRLRSGEQAESQDALELRKDLWVGRIYEDLRVAAERAAELNELLKQSLEGALGNAEEGLKSLGQEISGLALEQGNIQRLAGQGGIDLREGEERLAQLKARQKEMQVFIKGLQKAIKEENLTREVIQVLARAKLLEGQADYEDAMKLYQAALEMKSDQPNVQKHLERLKTLWTPKSQEHAKAREFIFRVWPRLEVSALTVTKAKQAQEALSVCRKADDALSARKLLRANASHAGNLKKRLDVLKQRDTEDNRAEARIIGQISGELGRLHEDAKQFLETAAKK